MGFERKTTQIIYPVIRNAADIPNYEAIVPARHVTTSMAALSQSIHLNNNFRGGIINRQRGVVYLLSSVSARSSVESLLRMIKLRLRVLAPPLLILIFMYSKIDSLERDIEVRINVRNFSVSIVQKFILQTHFWKKHCHTRLAIANQLYPQQQLHY